MKFTPEQNNIINRMKNPDNRTIVMAAPGSGKTTTISYGVQDIRYKFIAITFTNKAAKELIKKLDNNNAFFIGTFHGLGMKFLKDHGEKFIIIDQGESKELLKSCVKKLSYSSKTEEFNRIFTISSLRLHNTLDINDKDFSEDILKVEDMYKKVKINNNLKDFTDLLKDSLPYLSENDCKAVIIDEWQDTNVVQYDMLKELTLNFSKGFTVVGDQNQCLYTFRGACYENTEKLIKETNPEVLQLSHTWRFDEHIASYCNSLISHNRKNYCEKISANKSVTPNVDFIPFSESSDENVFILDSVKKYSDKDKTIAILGRTHSQLDQIASWFDKCGQPYTRIGGKSIGERAKTKRLIDLLCGIHPLDKEEYIDEDRIAKFLKFLRIGIGKRYIKQYLEYKNNGEKKKILVENEHMTNIIDSIMVGNINGVKEACKMLDKSDNTKCPTLLIDVIDSISKECESIHDLINRIKLMSSSDDEVGKITLATVHAVKGLEFDIVYIYGMEEGFYPSYMSEKDDLDSERRIAYVAMSRAKEKLIISWSFKRKARNSGLGEFRQMSRFIENMGYDPRSKQFVRNNNWKIYV